GAEVGGDRHVLEDRELPERTRDLEGPRDAPVADRVGREAGQLLTEEDDRARRSPERAGDAVEHRGLAGAIRADQAEDLALHDLERDRVERGEAPEVLGDPPDRQQDRKSTRLNSSHRTISYAVFCLKKKNTQ